MRLYDVVQRGGAGFLLALTFSLGGCGPKAMKTIVVDKLAFGPAPAELHVGEVVQWVNKDMFQHSATAEDASFDLDLQPGSSGSTPLRRTGLIKYYCRYHPGMTGVLRVAP